MILYSTQDYVIEGQAQSRTSVEFHFVFLNLVEKVENYLLLVHRKQLFRFTMLDSRTNMPPGTLQG